MPISTQLTQLARNVGALTADTNAIFEALRAKGVNVPANAQLSDVADMIESIVPPQTYVTIGGRQYKTVSIGNQQWLAENLDWKFDVDGSQISINPNGRPETPAAWYYDRDETSYGINSTYKCGLLYNGYAAIYLENNKSTLLPDGWHIPTSSEYTTLNAYIGTDSGSKLRAKDNSITSDWPSNWDGTDDYGWNALPAGVYNGTFNYLGDYTRFWSTTINGIYLKGWWTSRNANLTEGDNYKNDASSIRLVKDVT